MYYFRVTSLSFSVLNENPNFKKRKKRERARERKKKSKTKLDFFQFWFPVFLDSDNKRDKRRWFLIFGLKGRNGGSCYCFPFSQFFLPGNKASCANVTSDHTAFIVKLTSPKVFSPHFYRGWRAEPAHHETLVKCPANIFSVTLLLLKKMFRKWMMLSFAKSLQCISRPHFC